MKSVQCPVRCGSSYHCAKPSRLLRVEKLIVEVTIINNWPAVVSQCNWVSSMCLNFLGIGKASQFLCQPSVQLQCSLFAGTY